MSTWNDIANSERWRGLVEFIRNWIGPFDAQFGMPPDELDSILQTRRVLLPTAVREWLCLARNWTQGGLNVWIPPEELDVRNSLISILTDTEGLCDWYVRVEDFENADPPVISLAWGETHVASPSVSKFVAAMVINDVLSVDDGCGKSESLNPITVRTRLTSFLSSYCGTLFIDSPIESATIVAFAYPDDESAHGKARTPAGKELLLQLRD